jgi:hypothetical protein
MSLGTLFPVLSSTNPRVRTWMIYSQGAGICCAAEGMCPANFDEIVRIFLIPGLISRADVD